MRTDPICIRLSTAQASEKRQLRALRTDPTVRVIDELKSQYEELYCITHPRVMTHGVDSIELETYLAKQDIRDDVGIWAWYPRKRTVVHFLPEALHTLLRTARNQNLITPDEQQIYYQSRIGVAGLSVGSAVVSAIIHTGGGKYLSIADHDVLSGSNTNRIRVGFDAVGVPKSTLALEEILLLNPYAEVQVFDEGITEKNLRSFLTKPKKLDLVIDEMDTLYLKIQLRVEARKLGIPVIMAADNGDGIVVDIERFDLDPDRPLLHGDIPEQVLLDIRPDTPRAVAAKIISAWVRPENIAPRMKESLMQLGKTLYTWPQLGNAAWLAGTTMAYVARRILTGQPVNEGKFVFSPDAVFIPKYFSSSERRSRHQQTSQFIQAMHLDPP